MILTVYLAGGIQGLSDADCKDWRQDIIDKYTYNKHDVKVFNFLDPMRRDYRKYESSISKTEDSFNAEIDKEIVEFDKIDITQSDAVLFKFDKPSVGTAQENLYALMNGKLNVVWVPNPATIISPWMKYHSHKFVSSPDEGIKYIRDFFKDKI